MKKIMAGLALLAGTAMLISENSTAQMLASNTQLESLTGSSQQGMATGDTLWGSTGSIVLMASNTSGMSGALDIDRIEKRGRRVYAVVSLNDLMDLQPSITPAGLTSSRTIVVSPEVSSSATLMGSGSTSGNQDGGISLRNDPTEYESPGWTISGDVNDDLDINLLPNSSADDGGISLRNDPTEYESPGWTIGGDVNDDLDINLLPPGRSSSIEYMDDHYSSFHNDYLIDEDGVMMFRSDSVPGMTFYFLDGNVEEPAYIYDSNTGYFYDSRTGYLYGSQADFVTFDDDPVVLSGTEFTYVSPSGSDVMVAVPVVITGATCDNVSLALDLSAMHGTSIRTNNYHHVMPDRSLVTEGTLLPVTISSTSASSAMMVSDSGESDFCTLSSLVSGRGSTIAIVDHLNSLIGAPVPLTASR